MSISADQARDIANTFMNMSHDIGSYRRDNWKRLTETQRQDLEIARLDLLNYGNCLVTDAVGIVLADMEGDLKAISDATAEAKKAVTTIDHVKDVIEVTAALVQLGGAIASKNPAAIAGAAANAFKTAKKLLRQA